MMAAIILVVSLVTLLMFFVSYCRSLMASSTRHVLSGEVRDVTGITTTASGKDFTRVVQILKLCPDRREDRAGLQAVSLYYGLLGMLQRTVARLLPSIQFWAEHERAGCANFAAVVLDRRIAFSREILSREAEF
jgi:hypothetical protein